MISGFTILLQEERLEGNKEGKKEKAVEIAKSLLDILDIETIAKKTKLTIEEVIDLKEKTEHD